jgi:hypothetical protein
MAETITIDRQTIVNLYRDANSVARRAEILLRQFDLTDDSKERMETVHVFIPLK